MTSVLLLLRPIVYLHIGRNLCMYDNYVEVGRAREYYLIRPQARARLAETLKNNKLLVNDPM
jgi:hypothetical protein